MSSYFHLDPAIRRRTIASLAAGMIAFAINCVAIDFPGGAHLTFGSVISLVVALILGPGYGGLTAVFAGLPGLLHPYGAGGLLTHILEAIAVGFLVRRRMLSLYAAALYWCLIGTPIVIVLQHTWLGVPAGALWTICSKNVLNGLVNITIAELISALPRLRGWLGGPSRPGLLLRRHLTRMFMLGTAASFLALSIGLNWVQMGRMENLAGGHLQEAVVWVTSELDDYVDRNQTGLIALANTLDSANLDPIDVRRRFEKFHALYSEFRTLTLIGMDGLLIASDPQRTASGKPLLGVNLSDRDYVIKTIATRRAFVSDVFMAREMAADPIVVLTVPLNNSGAMVGMISGSLRCSSFQRLLDSLYSLKQPELLILDQQTRIIFA
ncbi:MAG: hypothetical protein ABSF22_27330, partial [Bryobacteraceae bacterium]